jgi:hypothetical protein
MTSDLDSDRLKAQQLAVSGYTSSSRWALTHFGEEGGSDRQVQLVLDLLRLKNLRNWFGTTPKTHAVMRAGSVRPYDARCGA